MLFLGLGLIELSFLSVFFLLLVIGVTFDRRGAKEPKWYIFGVGLAAIALYFWPDWVFFGSGTVPAVMNGATVVKAAHTQVVMFNEIRSWSLWSPLLMFIGTGLVYSCVEFVLGVRKGARHFTDRWARALNHSRDVRGADVNGDPMRGTTRMTGKALLELKANATNPCEGLTDACNDFLRDFTSNEYEFIRVSVDTGAPVPYVDKLKLTSSIGAWTWFWPAYLVSMVLGDLLTEVFTILANFLVSISGRFVRMTFSDVFKI